MTKVKIKNLNVSDDNPLKLLMKDGYEFELIKKGLVISEIKLIGKDSPIAKVPTISLEYIN